MSRKLLLADDSITIQKVIGITFLNEDFELSVVDNGDAALDKARAERPDIVLADVFMPGKNGYELCAAIKADPILSRTPVLLLTGTFEPFDEAKAKEAGADGWIAKPFESQTLISRVEELLERTEVVPTVPAAEVVPAVAVEGLAEEAEADLWEDFETTPANAVATADLAVEEAALEADDSDFADIFGPEDEDATPQVAAEATADDIWGDVSFAEEDLAPEPVVESVADDIWSVATAPEAEEPVPASGVAPTAFVTASEVSEPLETGAIGADAEEELFIFEDDESVDESASPEAVGEELLVYENEPESLPAAAEELPEELVELDEADVLPLDEAEMLEDEPVSASDAEAEADFVFYEDEVAEPEPDIVEPESAVVESEPTASEVEPVVTEAEPTVSGPESVVVAPEPTAVVPAVSVETQVRALSDEQLEAIVERVAGVVIERLAGTILEKIAWEVVPDLAEVLIKEEIRQIKESVR